jgi:hypothetical protein
MIAGDRVNVDEELECAVWVAGTVDDVADREHSTDTVLREELACGVQNNIFTMDIAEDAQPSSELLH